MLSFTARSKKLFLKTYRLSSASVKQDKSAKLKKQKKYSTQQLEESLGDISAEQMAAIILAYEPVWAIGSGHSALPEEVQAMHHFCRQWVKQKWGEKTAQKVIIQYGGSVHPNDAKDFMELPDVDGVLVGGASLTVESFNQIIHYSSVGD